MPPSNRAKHKHAQVNSHLIVAKRTNNPLISALHVDKMKCIKHRMSLMGEAAETLQGMCDEGNVTIVKSG